MKSVLTFAAALLGAAQAHAASYEVSYAFAGGQVASFAMTGTLQEDGNTIRVDSILPGLALDGTAVVGPYGDYTVFGMSESGDWPMVTLDGTLFNLEISNGKPRYGELWLSPYYVGFSDIERGVTLQAFGADVGALTVTALAEPEPVEPEAAVSAAPVPAAAPLLAAAVAGLTLLRRRGG